MTEWVPEERMGYELLEGMRVRSYRSTISLEEAENGGTTIRWRSTHEAAGPFTTVVLRLAMRDACKRLAKAAST